VLLVFLAGLVSCQSSPYAPVKQSVQLPLHSGEFKRAFSKDNDDGSGNLVLYIPQQETLANWTQMLTVQSLPAYRKSLSLTAHRFQEDLNDRCGASNVDWNIVQQTGESIIYETVVKHCGNAPDQYEMTRLFSGSNTLYRVSYVSKTPDQTKANRQKWFNVIARAHLEAVSDRQ
jgi:hypothetical protein